MRDRSFRRHQTDAHMRRRLSEFRNQLYRDVNVPRMGARAKARFKEQPQTCSNHCCGNQRKAWGRNDRTMRERRFFCKNDADWD